MGTTTRHWLVQNPVDFNILFTDLAFKLYCMIDYDGLTALAQHYLLHARPYCISCICDNRDRVVASVVCQYAHLHTVHTENVNALQYKVIIY